MLFCATQPAALRTVTGLARIDKDFTVHWNTSAIFESRTENTHLCSCRNETIRLLGGQGEDQDGISDPQGIKVNRKHLCLSRVYL